MLGFAVVDAHPGAAQWAVWLTSRTGTAMVDHTNAVVLDRAAPDFESTFNNLLTERYVLLTDGSSIGDKRPAANFDGLSLLEERTTALHAEILSAIAAYKHKTRNANLAVPDAVPARTFTPATTDTPSERALASANYLRRVWRDWLEMERERVRRTTHPRTGDTPWMMPAELNEPDIRALPSEVISLFTGTVS